MINYMVLLQVHQQPCHIVYTDYRPTPLQHYIFPSGGEGLYLVVDEKAKFREDSFQKAVNALVPKAEGEKKRENGKWQKGLNVSRLGEESDIFKMLKMIIRRQYDPVILFSFSKRECEFLAMQVGSFAVMKLVAFILVSLTLSGNSVHLFNSTDGKNGSKSG